MLIRKFRICDHVLTLKGSRNQMTIEHVDPDISILLTQGYSYRRVVASETKHIRKGTIVLYFLV
jgi:hypothetical protein